MKKLTADMSRRHWMRNAGVMAGATAFGYWPQAQAQANKRVVIGTWGGDYARLLNKHIDAPLMVPKGFEVIHDIGSDSDRRAKLRAEARLPRGTADIQALSMPQLFDMNAAGLCAPLDYSKLPNASNLLPQMRQPYGVGHIYSGKVIVYNPKLIAKAPTSFADALDPSHGSKLGFIDIQYGYTMLAATLASGGSATDYEPGKARLMACRKAGAKVLPTNEAMAQALMNEEIGICIMWKARAVQWQKAGAKIEAVAAKEGVPLYVSGFMIPKNARNKDGAHAWLDAMLSVQPQEGFAESMGYNPVVTNAKVAPELVKRIGFTEDERKRLLDPDFGYVGRNDAAFKEWWDKSFKG
jgi:putative spermidine/putrescine transport system substrate-binding protein